MERKIEGKGREGKEKEQELQLVRCCVWFLLFFFLFSFFKHRKTAFGLNLKEAESGMAVALGRELLEKGCHLQRSWGCSCPFSPVPTFPTKWGSLQSPGRG